MRRALNVFRSKTNTELYLTARKSALRIYRHSQGDGGAIFNPAIAPAAQTRSREFYRLRPCQACAQNIEVGTSHHKVERRSRKTKSRVKSRTAKSASGATRSNDKLEWHRRQAESNDEIKKLNGNSNRSWGVGQGNPNVERGVEIGTSNGKVGRISRTAESKSGSRTAKFASGARKSKDKVERHNLLAKPNDRIKKLNGKSNSNQKVERRNRKVDRQVEIGR